LVLVGGGAGFWSTDNPLCRTDAVKVARADVVSASVTQKEGVWRMFNVIAAVRGTGRFAVEVVEVRAVGTGRCYTHTWRFW
jgi:hypothetical protein